MREVTESMIKEFKIRELGYDFMGYHLNKGDIYTFHHLVVAHRDCKKLGIPNDGYIRANGCILFSLPHQYLHVIEQKDLDRFYYISSELLDQNIKGHLDVDNIRRIHDILEGFEREYSGARTRKGKILIKEEYTRRLHF